jgi:phage shock protein C
MSTQYKQLYRSRKNRMIGGVCAGLGEYFGIDPTLMRVLFILGVFLGFPGALGLIYLVMLIVVPDESVNPVITPTPDSATSPSS